MCAILKLGAHDTIHTGRFHKRACEDGDELGVPFKSYEPMTQYIQVVFTERACGDVDELGVSLL